MIIHTFFTLLAAAPICANNVNNVTTACTGLSPIAAGASQLNQILTIILGVLGAIAVLIIVISGLRFVSAQGNPQEITKARNTLLYAIIGLVIIASAEIIVAFVLGKV